MNEKGYHMGAKLIIEIKKYHKTDERKKT